jgi:hypothetical protein
MSGLHGRLSPFGWVSNPLQPSLPFFICWFIARGNGAKAYLTHEIRSSADRSGVNTNVSPLPELAPIPIELAE